MGYFDGNTVTALWNYAQHFPMSNNFSTTNMAITAGYLNLISRFVRIDIIGSSWNAH